MSSDQPSSLLYCFFVFFLAPSNLLEIISVTLLRRVRKKKGINITRSSA